MEKYLQTVFFSTSIWAYSRAYLPNKINHSLGVFQKASSKLLLNPSFGSSD